MRLIDADALERDGWSLQRTYRKDKETMMYEVKAISEIPTVQPDVPYINDGDTVYRQAVIDAIEKYDFDFPQYMDRFVVELRDAMKADLKDDISKLLPAQPEQEDCTELKREFIRMAKYIDVLLECSDEQKETLIGFISRLAEFTPWTERD